jgi:hypothetical protein
MTTIGLTLFIVWVVCTFVCLINSRDIASPVMFVCASLGVYFSHLFFIDYRIEVIFLYILICCITAFLSFFYLFEGKLAYCSNSDKTFFHSHQTARADLIIWTLSIVPILSQLYMVQMFGGIESYVIAAKWGTKNFHGLGPLKTLNALYYPMSLSYFAIFINRKNRIGQKVSFSFHFFVFIFLAFLTLSRGTLLTHIVCMGLVYHYSRKKVRISTAVIGLATLLALASVYGVLRETVSYENGAIKLNWGSQCVSCDIGGSNEKYKSEWMFAGLFPLERILLADSVDKVYGQTYITAITNFVPRSFWPEKPDPGGVVFTSKYATGFYDEYSHFATGLFPEAMINFGHFGGVIFGFLQLSVCIIILSKIHRKFYLDRQGSIVSFQELRNLIIFVYVLHAFGVLIIGEFTSVVIGVLIKIFMILIVFHCLRYRRFSNVIEEKKKI